MKRNVSGDFPGSKDDLLVVAALNPLLHKFEHFEYFSDFISFEDLLEFFFFQFPVASCCIYQYALFCLSFIVPWQMKLYLFLQKCYICRKHMGVPVFILR